jgi:hypothetical protein
METIEIISLMLGAAWASGINLYAAVLVLGWLGNAGHVELPPGLELVDKIPGVDTGWDALQTFVRIPAGALMAAGAAQGLDVGQAAEFAALLLGGGVATASHAAKAGSRVLINTSPEPFSNWGASVAEDVSVVAGLWTALNHPWVFIALFVLFVLVVVWLLPKIWRAIRRAVHAIRHWFSGESSGTGRRTRAALVDELNDGRASRPDGHFP